MIQNNSGLNRNERTRLFLAENTKEIIVTEGIENFSVRKLAQKAGSALKTIYNHFNNADEVLWQARSLMIADLGLFMMRDNPEPITNLQLLKKMFFSYVTYFIENPNIYRFFYFHQLDKQSKTTDSLADSKDFQYRIAATLAFLIKDGTLSMEEVQFFYKKLLYSIQGMLTMIISGNDNLEAKDLYQFIDELIISELGNEEIQ